MLERYRAQMARDYSSLKLGDRELSEELDADMMGMMMQDIRFVQEVAQELERRNAGAGARFVQAFLDTIDAALAEMAKIAAPSPLQQRILEDYTRKRTQVASLLADFSERYRTAQPGEGGGARYSLVTDPATLNGLESGETIRVYRAAQVIDGKLYPPMAAKVDGKLVQPIELGKWEQSDERPEMRKDNGKFKLDKANGAAIEAAYNPYFHTSRSPLNDQFSSAYKRGNLVTLEVEVPVSELTSGYRAEGAKDAVGEMAWHSGPVSSKLTGDKARRVILSRYDKPIRIVPDSEVADRIAGILDGENLAVPWNVVTPSLREELQKRGVRIEGQNRYSLEASRPYMTPENKEGQTEGSVLNNDFRFNGGSRLDLKSMTALNQSFDLLHNIAQGKGRKEIVGRLAEIFKAFADGKPSPGLDAPMTVKGFRTALTFAGFERSGEGAKSLYLRLHDSITRISDHSANADLFIQDGTDNNLSIVIQPKHFNKQLIKDDASNVIEAVYHRTYLESHPEALAHILRDIAEFIATGEYHDTAGAIIYNFSGSEEYMQRCKDTLLADAIRRGDSIAEERLRQQGAKVPESQPSSVRMSIASRLNALKAELEAKGGVLALVHHGTTQSNFTRFNPDKSVSGHAIFFTDSRDVAAGYADTGQGDADKRALGQMTPDELADAIRKTGAFGFAQFDEYGDALTDIFRNRRELRDHLGRDVGDDMGDVYESIEVKQGDEWVALKVDDLSLLQLREIYIDKVAKLAADDDVPDTPGVFNVAVRMDKPLVIDADGANWTDLRWEGKTYTTDELAEKAWGRGYDGVVVRNVYDNASGAKDLISNVYIVNPDSTNNIKFVDEMTYDDQGNIIPAEKRLDWGKDEMRYSLAHPSTALQLPPGNSLANSQSAIIEILSTATDADVAKRLAEWAYARAHAVMDAGQCGRNSRGFIVRDGAPERPPINPNRHPTEAIRCQSNFPSTAY